MTASSYWSCLSFDLTKIVSSAHLDKLYVTVLPSTTLPGLTDYSHGMHLWPCEHRALFHLSSEITNLRIHHPFRMSKNLNLLSHSSQNLLSSYSRGGNKENRQNWISTVFLLSLVIWLLELLITGFFIIKQGSCIPCWIETHVLSAAVITTTLNRVILQYPRGLGLVFILLGLQNLQMFKFLI